MAPLAEQLQVAVPALLAGWAVGFVHCLLLVSRRDRTARDLAIAELFRGKSRLDNRSVWARARRAAKVRAKLHLRRLERHRAREFARARVAGGTWRL